MPLRYVRGPNLKVSASSALSIAITTTSIASELADIAQFPPVKAAATILLVIFQTIQSVQTNRADCYRLARRCLSLLVDIKDQLEGRWERAPDTLLKNVKRLEGTLESISACMSREAGQKWHNRLLRKGTIESSITDFNAELDDAVRSFQVTTLINIHYAVGKKQSSSNDADYLEAMNPPPQYSKRSAESLERIQMENARDPPISRLSMSSFSEVDNSLEGEKLSSIFVSEPDFDSSSINAAIAKAVPAAVVDIANDYLDNRGFRRYHQSEVILKGRTLIRNGWWAGSKTATVDGRSLLMRPYEGCREENVKKWMRDVKMLQNLYHPNLPQMVGYSDDESPTPFILLANVQTRLPQALVLDTIQHGSLLSCAKLLLRLYRETFDAALYMQHQLNLSDSKTQDYVENSSFRIDVEQSLVMGLPPPEVDNWVSFRNYGLAHSVRDVYLKILPNRGYTNQPHDPEDPSSIEVQYRVNHLAVLVRALLPSSGDANTLNERLSHLLGEDSEDSEQTISSLAQIRAAAILTGSHDHTWRQNTVPPYKYHVGDLGYLPKGKDFGSFVVLCNVLKNGDTSLDVSQHATGWQSSWNNGFLQRQELAPFPQPPNLSGWPVVVPPGTQQDLQVVHEAMVIHMGSAWNFLLQNGRRFASVHKIKPQDLILITRVGTDQRFTVKDLRTINFHHIHPPAHQRPPFGHSPHMMNRPGLGHPQFGGQHQLPGLFSHPGQQLTPMVFYLFSSPEKSHEPVWSESPIYQPPIQAPPMRAKCICSVRMNYGFMNFVQLHEEDFA